MLIKLVINNFINYEFSKRDHLRTVLIYWTWQWKWFDKSVDWIILNVFEPILTLNFWIVLYIEIYCFRYIFEYRDLFFIRLFLNEESLLEDSYQLI